MLIKYLPDFMQSFQQLRELTKAEDLFLKKLKENTDLSLKNTFIPDADELSIAHFEKIVGITPGPNDNLETRRLDVLARFNQKLPYTIISLKNTLDNIIGQENYSMDLDYSTFRLDIFLKVSAKNKVALLKNILEFVLPLNIVFSINIKYNTWGALQKYTWVEVHKDTWKGLKEKI